MTDPHIETPEGLCTSAIPGPASRKLLERLKQCVGNANYTGLYGVCLAKGEGSSVEDVDGNRYVDFLTAASSNILGYHHPELADCYANAARAIQHSCFTYSPNTHAIELAERLIQITPGSFSKKVLFGLSGSDASGGAIKACRRYTNRDGIIHFKNDYHGSTGLSQEASHFGNLNAGLYPTETEDFWQVDFPTTAEAAQHALEQIELILKKRQAGGVIAEPIQGDAGAHLPAPGFFADLRSLTEKYGALLIIDEVQSGMGRTGKWWAIEHEEVVPDILITAKSLSAGYAAISALIGRSEVLDSLNHGQHLFTYGGHAPSAAVALRNIELITASKCIEDATTKGAKIIEELSLLRQAYPNIIKDVRGRGLMIGMEIAIHPDDLAGKVFATRCVEKGVYVGFFGLNGEVVRIEPPLLISDHEIDQLLRVAREVAEEMNSGEIPQQTYDNVHAYSIGI